MEFRAESCRWSPVWLCRCNCWELNRVAVAFIGDGTLGEGAVYETFNVASKWELPLLIVLENNGYAQSTPQSQNLAGDIVARAAAFGIATREGSTWEPENLVTLARDCVEQVRSLGRPVFLKVDTYRLMAHSKSDDDRDVKEVESYWGKDPLRKFPREKPGRSCRVTESGKKSG